MRWNFIDEYEAWAMKLSYGMVLVFFVAVIGIALLKGIDVPTCVTDFKPFDKGELIQVGPKEYQLKLLGRMWAFQPNEIVIPAGSKVTIYTTSLDVQHGFEIEGKAVNLMVIPGAVNKAEVVFNRPGEYRFVCNEFCGIGHQGMFGVFKVLPEVEYDKWKKEHGK
ncbi:MAG: cytochrome C oxidase subunit II [Thermotogae bacterium]|nr:cytochrome C oxidase subunit II [Thermotogota bacterium]